MLKQLKGDEKIYKLSLSDGKVWGFSATESIFQWLDELREIMQLEESNESEIDHKLLFLSLNKNNLPPDADESQWKSYKQGSVYRIWSHEHKPETFVELNKDFIDHNEIKVINMWSSLKVIYRHYINQNGGPIHAAFAEFNGKGIFIAASGGTGKSTCSRRLPDYWKALSDDTALIVRDKSNNFRVHPMPTWSDHLWSRKFSTFNSSYSIPLSALFFLEQAPIDEVIPLSKAIATQRVFESLKQVWDSYWEREEKSVKNAMVTKLFNTACDIAARTPCYTLKATLYGKFWEEIEKVL